MSAVSERLAGYTVVHEDFRLAPEKSAIRDDYQQLILKRVALVLRQEKEQVAKNEADLQLSRAQQQPDSAKKATPPKPDDAGIATQIADATAASAKAAAMLLLISAAITIAQRASVNMAAPGGPVPGR